MLNGGMRSNVSEASEASQAYGERAITNQLFPCSEHQLTGKPEKTQELSS